MATDILPPERKEKSAYAAAIRYATNVGTCLVVRSTSSRAAGASTRPSRFICRSLKPTSTVSSRDQPSAVEHNDTHRAVKLAVRYQLQHGLLVGRFLAQFAPHAPERHQFVEHEIDVVTLIQRDKARCPGHLKPPFSTRGAAGDFGFLRTYFAHNLSSAANCSIISTTRFSFSGPSF